MIAVISQRRRILNIKSAFDVCYCPAQHIPSSTPSRYHDRSSEDHHYAQHDSPGSLYQTDQVACLFKGTVLGQGRVPAARIAKVCLKRDPDVLSGLPRSDAGLLPMEPGTSRTTTLSSWPQVLLRAARSYRTSPEGLCGILKRLLGLGMPYGRCRGLVCILQR